MSSKSTTNKMRKPILRRCVATNERYEKKDLLRIVKNKEGEVFIDLTGKSNGRGAYLVKTAEALAIAQKNNSLGRALEIVIPAHIYDEIAALINESSSK